MIHHSPRHRDFRAPAILRLLATALVGMVVATQLMGCRHAPGIHQHGMAQDAGDHAAHASPEEPIQMSPHLRSTPHRQATAADSARLKAIADSLRRSTLRYRDARAAGADGYARFTPERQQRMVHFTHGGNAARNDSSFDPARPTSLLYRREAGGSLVLAGAMYTAPKDASMEELNSRVPLSMAHWHLHTNVCAPRRGDNERWNETRDGTRVFGPQGGIATKEACDAVGGQFRETEFNWMVHANFEADGSITWGH